MFIILDQLKITLTRSLFTAVNFFLNMSSLFTFVKKQER